MCWGASPSVGVLDPQSTGLAMSGRGLCPAWAAAGSRSSQLLPWRVVDPMWTNLLISQEMQISRFSCEISWSLNMGR